MQIGSARKKRGFSSQRKLIFTAPGYAAFGEVVRADFEFDVVAFDYTDIIKAEFTRNICGDYVSVGQFYPEVGVGKALYYLALRFDNVVF